MVQQITSRSASDVDLSQDLLATLTRMVTRCVKKSACGQAGVEIEKMTDTSDVMPHPLRRLRGRLSGILQHIQVAVAHLRHQQGRGKANQRVDNNHGDDG